MGSGAAARATRGRSAGRAASPSRCRPRRRADPRSRSRCRAARSRRTHRAWRRRPGGRRHGDASLRVSLAERQDADEAHLGVVAGAHGEGPGPTGVAAAHDRPGQVTRPRLVPVDGGRHARVPSPRDLVGEVQAVPEVVGGDSAGDPHEASRERDQLPGPGVAQDVRPQHDATFLLLRAGHSVGEGDHGETVGGLPGVAEAEVELVLAGHADVEGVEHHAARERVVEVGEAVARGRATQLDRGLAPGRRGETRGQGRRQDSYRDHAPHAPHPPAVSHRAVRIAMLYSAPWTRRRAAARPTSTPRWDPHRALHGGSARPSRAGRRGSPSTAAPWPRWRAGTALLFMSIAGRPCAPRWRPCGGCWPRWSRRRACTTRSRPTAALVSSRSCAPKADWGSTPARRAKWRWRGRRGSPPARSPSPPACRPTVTSTRSWPRAYTSTWTACPPFVATARARRRGPRSACASTAGSRSATAAIPSSSTATESSACNPTPSMKRWRSRARPASW